MGIAAWLLHDVGITTARCFTISGGELAVTNGAAAISLPTDSGVLVVGDGSAGRHEKAPGHVRPGAVAADDQVASALRSGDAQSLLSIPDSWQADLLCSGCPVWKAAARLALDHGQVTSAELSYYDAPHHVGYFVAQWQVTETPG